VRVKGLERTGNGSGVLPIRCLQRYADGWGLAVTEAGERWCGDELAGAERGVVDERPNRLGRRRAAQVRQNPAAAGVGTQQPVDPNDRRRYRLLAITVDGYQRHDDCLARAVGAVLFRILFLAGEAIVEFPSDVGLQSIDQRCRLGDRRVDLVPFRARDIDGERLRDAECLVIGRLVDLGPPPDSVVANRDHERGAAQVHPGAAAGEKGLNVRPSVLREGGTVWIHKDVEVFRRQPRQAGDIEARNLQPVQRRLQLLRVELGRIDGWETV
jgi:hypothetical protein